VSWKKVSLSLLLDGYKKKGDRMKETEDIFKLFKEKGLHVEISPHIDVKPNLIQKTEVEAKAEAEAKVKINLKIDLPVIQSEFREFKREVTKLDDELDEELVDLEDELLVITPASEEGKVNKAINKLSLFMQKLKDEDSRFSRIVKGTKKGMELAQKLAVTYNKFARELGLDPVQDLFL
jgi:hypothetical protein